MSDYSIIINIKLVFYYVGTKNTYLYYSVLNLSLLSHFIDERVTNQLI